MKTLRLEPGLLGLVLLLLACDPKKPPAPPETEDREKLARALMLQAAVSTPPNKIELYEKVIGFYPETAEALVAHRERVRYLLDPGIDRAAEAFDAAQAFAVRHPDHLEVSECFRWLDNRAGMLDLAPERRVIQDRWWKFVTELEARGAARNDDDKAMIAYEVGDVAMRRREPKLAEEKLALAASLPVSAQDFTLRTLVQLAQVQARDLVALDRARSTYERALVLSRAGVRGATPEAIQTAIAELVPAPNPPK